ncbi:hypothetical protein Egran_01912 [Elaphomyces granulatus]|uniref:Uncharacterized protein n=1 Tax=Elaphomyces granulatus TaxID=519963 RepID=A0A232M1Q6_9EURO|nr:hypothetical protein Egran_01912 [Elaphomyces granulatus]
MLSYLSSKQIQSVTRYTRVQLKMDYDINYPSPPELVRSKGFTYGEDGIKANNIPRASLSDLRLLFRKNAASFRVRAATKPWVTAQLKLYGIPFKKSDGAQELKATLETAVKNGQCNTLAPSIAALEKSLSEEYSQKLKAYAEQLDHWRDHEFNSRSSPTQEANFDLDRFLAKYFLDGLQGQPAPHKTKDPLSLEYVNNPSNFKGAVQSIAGLGAHISTRGATVVGWKSHLERGIDVEFAKLDSPAARFHVHTSEADFDLDRFLAKYFLDGLNGKPAPHKTPDPITLFPFFEHRNRLREAVALIPGLCVAEAKGSNGKKTIIGWDVNKIQSKVRHIEEKLAREKAEAAAEARAERERVWQHTLHPHREYVRRNQAPSGPLKLDDIRGSYIVRSEKIMEEYSDDNDVMTLDIVNPRSPSSTTATFHFGIVEGTMLLAMSEDSLQMLRQEMEVDSDEDTDEDSSDDLSTSVHGTLGSRKRAAKGTLVAPGPVKRSRSGMTPNTNRIYLQWAGRETGEGVIQLDTDDHTGYIDFNETKLTGNGVFCYPEMFGKSDSQVSFSIFKVADQPSKTPEPWSDFSEKQYDYECSARWGNCW